MNYKISKIDILLIVLLFIVLYKFLSTPVKELPYLELYSMIEPAMYKNFNKLKELQDNYVWAIRQNNQIKSLSSDEFAYFLVDYNKTKIVFGFCNENY